MSSLPATVRVSRRIAAPPERVFRAWIDPAIAGRWLFATATQPMTRVAIDARVDGAFLLADPRNGTAHAYSGRYLEVDPPRRLAFTLASARRPDASTRVSVEIVPRGTGCDVQVVSAGLLAGDAGLAEARWTGMLYGLALTLATTGAGSARAPTRRSRR